VFDHVGAFVYNNEKNVMFEPEANINYHAGSFGLESFQWFSAKEYDVRKRVIRHINKEPMRGSTTRNNLWRAAILIPVLALLIAVPLKTDRFKARVEAASLNPLVTAEFENNKKAIDEAVVIVPDSNITVRPETPAKPVEELNYSIITGSFKSEENAISHMSSLKAEGYEPEIHQAPNGFFRVTAMTCASIEKALSTRDSISKKFPGTWISKK
jgi:SPOR domain